MPTAKDVLDAVTNEIVVQIMEENGSPLYSTSIDNRTNQLCYWFKTICHNGNSHKLCYFTQTKDFYCYTNCGRMTFFTFIMKILPSTNKEKPFYQALKYVADKVGISLNNREGFSIAPDKYVKIEDQITNEFLKSKELYVPNMKIEKTYNENILKCFDDELFYTGWIKEGITIDSMKKFGIRWWNKEQHIIIPHYDINGKFVGMRRRTLNPDELFKGKYMPEYIGGIMYEHPLGLNLYGIYQNKDAIKKYKRAFIVEGEKSVLLSDSYYGNDSTAVATCGFNVSLSQIYLLKKLGVEKIYLCFDKDFDDRSKTLYMKDKVLSHDYEMYNNKLNSICDRIYSEDIKVYQVRDKHELLDLKDSPFDKGKTTLEKLIQQSKLYTPN